MAAAAPDISSEFIREGARTQGSVGWFYHFFMEENYNFHRNYLSNYFHLCLIGWNCMNLELQLQSRLGTSIFVWG